MATTPPSATRGRTKPAASRERIPQRTAWTPLSRFPPGRGGFGAQAVRTANGVVGPRDGPERDAERPPEHSRGSRERHIVTEDGQRRNEGGGPLARQADERSELVERVAAPDVP